MTTQTDSVKYDAVDWHLGGDYPGDLGRQGGRTHIGLYLAWLVEKGLLANTFTERYPEQVRQCKDHLLTGSQLLQDCCDDVLVSEDMTPIGKAFSDFYYDDLYLDDYVDTLDDEIFPSIYHVPDNWDTYETLHPVLEQRYEHWRGEQGLDG
ncbi:hypothetical protein [Alcaligenes endophyticus]|uniref:DUF7832 domain-containing protein n=1 Tax=Alcaligenes endophyticus TaxID=1929088 RepID=A0ABT8EJ96_9BURK|nr:hypothetical protein [Alcaligenes endophyticus]MCX5591674.1 hypothetical protein [Alcaligenes endophyticus]MDN4121351.1 hypothetical protein [Alcaligenes endophyticus]